MIPEPSSESTRPTRRGFLQTAAGFLGALLTPAGVWAHPRPAGRRRKLFHIYRWSGRGRRASRAALSHAANRRYLTIGAAQRDQPHPKSHLRLVRLDVSLSEIFRLFVFRRRLVVDLRHLG
jgi:hypothetical protein